MCIRALRVLRVFKCFKFFRPLKSLLDTLITSFPSYAAILILTVLFWVVFAIMGMSVFGGQPLDLSYLIFPSYPNFDTFLSSMLISFQVGAVRGQDRGGSFFVLRMVDLCWKVKSTSNPPYPCRY